MNDEIEILTGLTEKERKRVLTWAISLPEEKLISVFQDAVRKSFQIKNEHPEILGRVSKYCAFILASRSAGWDSLNGKGYRIAGIKQFTDFSEIRKAKAATLIRKGRNPILRKKILAYWAEVKELKREGIGFRPISNYLQKNRKVKASPSYLAKLWNDVENAQIGKKEIVDQDESSICT
jgi:hypothetical protein